MRIMPIILASITLLTACDGAPDMYVNSPGKRTAHIDDYQISVVPEGGDTYVAWGGAEAKDGKFIQYRQRRAIELVSGCRVKEVLSKKDDAMLRAKVKC